MEKQERENQNLLSRRDLFKMAGAGAGSLLLMQAPVEPVDAFSEIDASEHASMLYDATKCVGCKSCEQACKDWNNLPVGATPAQDLSGDTFTLIKQYANEDGSVEVFRKYQCMHCVYPACASVCPVSALYKLDWGPVVYDEGRCLGCRYCMQACPYEVPRYDWSKSFPLIRKCTFCVGREGGAACAEACPTGALIYGKRKDLLELAQQRIADNPGTYFQDRVYGQNEVGGTSVLYLAPVSFQDIGLPKVDERPLPKRTEWALKIVPGIIVGVGSLMTAIYWITKRRQELQEVKED
jgi:formate dehydrogenase iron-sulfur subunit